MRFKKFNSPSAHKNFNTRFKSDVGQNVAQELTLYYSGPIYTGGPLNAYWAKGASLGPDAFVRKSPWDQKYL